MRSSLTISYYPLHSRVSSLLSSILTDPILSDYTLLSPPLYLLTTTSTPPITLLSSLFHPNQADPFRSYLIIPSTLFLFPSTLPTNYYLHPAIFLCSSQLLSLPLFPPHFSYFLSFTPSPRLAFNFPPLPSQYFSSPPTITSPPMLIPHLFPNPILPYSILCLPYFPSSLLFMLPSLASPHPPYLPIPHFRLPTCSSPLLLLSTTITYSFSLLPRPGKKVRRREGHPNPTIRVTVRVYGTLKV